jgi:hypothetical protein
MNEEQKKIIFEKSGFKCSKCEYYSPLGQGLEINSNFNIVLCNVCNVFAPEDKDKFASYLNDKIEWQFLESFRNSGINRASHSPHKQGMIAKSKEGKLVARPPLGYNVKKGELILDEEASEVVREIFKGFAEGSSLNQLSKKYNLSVNGIKKILKNFSYLGKIKFDKQISQGTHKPLVSAELFNRVQQIFEQKNKERIKNFEIEKQKIE